MSDLLDTYLEESIYNEKRIGIQERINIVLQNKFKLVPKGKECFLMGDLVKVYTPYTFYKRINQENITHIYDELEELIKQKGKFLVDEDIYLSDVKPKIASNKVLADDMYKKLQEQNAVLRQELVLSQEAYQLIIHSRAWKITSPFRKIVDIFKKIFGGKEDE